MVFFPSQEPPGKLEKVDYDLADKLHKTVVDNLQIKRAWNRQRWAKEFSILRKELGNSDRLKQVLDWYSSNCKAKNVPSIISATKFRHHFAWLEKLAQRGVSSVKVISPEAQAIARKLTLYRTWPKGSADQVPEIVQLSMERYQRLREAILQYSKKDIGILSQDFCRIVLNRLGPSDHFVEHWMLGVHDQIANWKEWSGQLSSFAFSIDHTRFQRMGLGLAASWGDREAWKRLMKEIGT